jgi:hypothetical protein
MNRKHVTGIALLIALAAVAGLLAVARSAGLTGASGSAATTALVQARTAQLDRYESALRKRVASVDVLAAGSPAVTPTTAAPVAQKVVYVRPAPIVRTIHRSNGGEGGGREASDD